MERPLESVPRWSLYGAGWPPWTRWLAALAVGASLMACIALLARRDGGTRIGDVWVVSLTVTNAIVCCLHAAADARAGIDRAQADQSAPIVTTIEPKATWYLAEANHQDYWATEGQRNPYCVAIIPPKLAKLRKSFQARLKTAEQLPG